MNILVNKNCEVDLPINQIFKDIICPECKENALIDIKNFKIRLYGYKNNHNTKHISLNIFSETQKIDISKIICEICNKNNKKYTHNNNFYLCNTCNKNLSPLCK